MKAFLHKTMAKCLSQPENIVLLLSADIAPFGFGYPEPNVKKSVKSLTYADPPEMEIDQDISACSRSGDFTPSKGSRNTVEEKILRDSMLDTFSCNAKKDDSSNYIQDDTLSMIDSLRTVECLSWTCDGFSDKLSSSFVAYDAGTVTLSHCTSTTTILPKSSTSYGFSICERNTNSDTTCTVLNIKEAQVPSESYHIPVNGRKSIGSIISSWTLASLDRSDVVSGVLRIKYPWSPSSGATTNRLSSKTDSDLYPSSSATKDVMFRVSTDSTLPIPSHRSKVNTTTMTSPSSRMKLGLTPMEYLIMSTEQLDADPIVQLGSQIIEGCCVKKKS